MQPWWRLVDLRPGLWPDLLSLSPALAETVARGVVASATPAILLRTQAPYVLLGPKDRRLPTLERAVHWLRTQELPAVFRLGGGSAVLLDGGCLSFAVVRPSRDLTAWQGNFIQMTEGVLRGLRRLGLAVEFGEAPGSYCPGAYDLLLEGKKIAGIAQAIRGGYAMVSGMILVNQDPMATTTLLQEFYARAGDGRRLSPDAVTRLDAAIDVTIDQVFDALVSGFGELHNLHPLALSPDERLLAERLYRERTLA